MGSITDTMISRNNSISRWYSMSTFVNLVWPMGSPKLK
jgi:hypothetical protein